MRKSKFIFLILIFLFTFRISFSQVILNSSEQAAFFAIENSKDFKLQKMQADALLRKSKYSVEDFLPTFSFSFSENDSVKYGGADSRNKSINISAKQIIFDGGERKLEYDMNKASAFFTLKEYEQNLNSFKSQVIAQYYNCILQQESVKIKQSLEQATYEQLQIIKAEYDLGMALENDYLEYLISYKDILNEKRKSQRELRTQFRNFKTMLSLDPESEIIINNTEEPDEENILLIEKYTDKLWNRLKKENPQVKKEETNLFYAHKKYLYSQRIFIPELSLQGGATFTGEQYPLSNPDYTVKLAISFSNNPFLPLAIESGLGFNSKRKFDNVSNTCSSSFNSSPSYFEQRKIQSISDSQQTQSNKNTLTDLFETLFEKIAAYDDSIEDIKNSKETIALQKRRLVVSKEELDKGEITRIDYLEELEKLSQEEIELLQSQTTFSSTVRELEILLCLPFGGLKNALK